MNGLVKRRYEMLTRVRDFGVKHGQLFPTNSSAQAAFAIVTAEVGRLDALNLTERGASRAARAARILERRRRLVDALVRAKNTARVLVKTIPELTTQVELPDGANDQRLLSVTRQFIEAIGPYAEQFAAHGITTDELRQRVEDLETTLTEQELRRKEQKQSREQIEGSMTRALEALETLDVAVANHLASDPEQLAAWKRSRVLPRTKRREAADAEAIPAPAAPEAAGVPAAPDAAPSPPVAPAERAA